MLQRLIAKYIGKLHLRTVDGWRGFTHVSKHLTLLKLSDHCYIHTCQDCNGLLCVDNGHAVVVSTPPSNEETRQLIDWISTVLHAEIAAFVIDRWHPDAMGGLHTVIEAGIPSYANHRTCHIARQKHLPVPEQGFRESIILKAGDKTLECRYFGHAHTTDGITAWLPDERVLFGGNAVRSSSGWVGNIADADLGEWSKTVADIKNAYPDADIVIPGHGQHGGPELLDYTIRLYRGGQWSDILRHHDFGNRLLCDDFGSILQIAEKVTWSTKGLRLRNAIIFVDQASSYATVESAEILHKVSAKCVKAGAGRMRIFTKTSPGANPLADYFFKGLSINLREDDIGMTTIARSIVRII